MSRCLTGCRVADCRALLLQWLLVMTLLLASTSAQAEDGYDLWLHYQPLANAAQLRDSASELIVAGDSPSLHAARDELQRGLSGLLGSAPHLADAVTRDGAIVLGTATAPQIAALKLDTARLGREGYLIRSVSAGGHRITAIVGGSDIGALYGAFHILRLLQTGQSLAALDVHESPRLQLRLLNHWDNLDGVVERGYAGASLWNWQTLPGYLDPRYTDYARANASLGINGTVLNNVNAKAWSLTLQYLDKAAALANVFRPYGIRVFLSARFSAPIEIGGLKTADPLDPQVQRWWRDKANKIYARIPDFGGFLVKANSEGQPGPQDYGRSHADGANLLADALAPHGGVVMWRAFVYSHEQADDRAKQAYSEFVPLDGKFRDNVIVQVKNGAIDFQPREPFHPLFGAMRKTPLMPEFQITKEYLGFSTHLAYLGTLFAETLQADTYARGKGSTVAKTVDGSLFNDTQRARLTGIAGVANIGADRNWSGSIFDQANWYAYGRLAWNPELSPQTIAQEWVRMTFSNDAAVVTPVVDMMLRSREAVVDYMTPLGLHHLMGRGHHYGPAPWDAGSERPDWDPVYYHRADRNGIGFDRSASGSNAVVQYAKPVAQVFGDVQRVPERDLLWFHHVAWDHRMASGRPLWDELLWHYDHGVDEVRAMRTTWQSLAGKIDAPRYRQVANYLAIQQDEAQWWRDASIAYFQSVSGRPLPAGTAPPAHPLTYYQALKFPYAPGNPK
ncbi:Extracellular xylan exo-alpha-(1-_2)-glucuronosidase [Xanthomonas hydrangeae]|nr:Extracellular xylan exo-alpha-(1->2)-glucuronosidase [Xanthomonas hydrangeae]CAD7730113.1 Extracellular xylan exo-alpha-(1->2)-glucuronosidase [Xanthomonas hydrangeae]CAD7745342.1 Extracellular xylan exo-alpha-(1->2)-glucuronosidase [Xanthomonas hydrangeae]CAD7745345.1 Extracellular xylan exo-alpha-(1->2)-glucuronosidase [Xanthomonas hydrangeae]